MQQTTCSAQVHLHKAQTRVPAGHATVCLGQSRQQRHRELCDTEGMLLCMQGWLHVTCKAAFGAVLQSHSCVILQIMSAMG